MIYAYKEFIPVIHPTAFVHPQASVTGCVVIGKDVYIGPFAAIRGDFGAVYIEDGCNVQENCTIHMFPGIEVRLRENAHIGHGAIIHGSIIGVNCLIGMNAVIMDEAEIGDNSIVGAMSFIKEKMVIPPGSLVVGNPAKIIKTLSQEMIDWKSKGTELYQQLARDSHLHLKPCEPLTVLPDHYPTPTGDYKSWKKQ
ncbi:MAG: transferase hexapeptide repeat family protein [Saprospiraceae bacterium]|nr:transferase hexapeptide repeat family protein [Saprospiraceae bacterium]